MKIPKTLGLSEELWEEIEARRGYENRSAFVERNLRIALELQAPSPKQPLPVDEKAVAAKVVRDQTNRQMVPEPVSRPEASASELQGLKNIASVEKSLTWYSCPEERCVYGNPEPGVCVHHRKRKLVKA